MLNIVFFREAPGGSAPAYDYIDALLIEAEKLDKKGKAQTADKKRRLAERLLNKIDFAAEHDGVVLPPAGKKLYDYPMLELREKASQTLIRTVYFVHHKADLVILHIFDKKEGQPTPPKELVVANQRRQLYLTNLTHYAFRSTHR